MAVTMIFLRNSSFMAIWRSGDLKRHAEDSSHRNSGKYPPAEPGALGIGPLKAAGLDPKLHLCGPRRKHFLEIPTRYPIFSATVGEQIPLDILRPHLARF